MTDATADTAAPARRGLPVWVMFAMLALGAGLLVAAFVVPTSILRPKPTGVELPPASVQPPQAFDYAPEFSLTERSGRTVTQKDLQGRVWVACFVFTRCTMGCRQVTDSMVKLQDDLKLADRDDVRLVTFTVDPERDTTKDLQEYADYYHADKDKWLFLTSDNGEYVRALARTGFKVSAQKKEKPTKDGDEFEHSTRLVVVDKIGRVRKHFDGKVGEHAENDETYQAEMKALRELVEALAKE